MFRQNEQSNLRVWSYPSQSHLSPIEYYAGLLHRDNIPYPDVNYLWCDETTNAGVHQPLVDTIAEIIGSIIDMFDLDPYSPLLFELTNLLLPTRITAPGVDMSWSPDGPGISIFLSNIPSRDPARYVEQLLREGVFAYQERDEDTDVSPDSFRVSAARPTMRRSRLGLGAAFVALRRPTEGSNDLTVMMNLAAVLTRMGVKHSLRCESHEFGLLSITRKPDLRPRRQATHVELIRPPSNHRMWSYLQRINSYVNGSHKPTFRRGLFISSPDVVWECLCDSDDEPEDVPEPQHVTPSPPFTPPPQNTRVLGNQPPSPADPTLLDWHDIWGQTPTESGNTTPRRTPGTLVPDVENPPMSLPSIFYSPWELRNRIGRQTTPPTPTPAHDRSAETGGGTRSWQDEVHGDLVQDLVEYVDETEDEGEDGETHPTAPTMATYENIVQHAFFVDLSHEYDLWDEEVPEEESF